MAQQIQLRRGTASAWTTANPTLASVEIGWETDTDQFKVGDGVTAWASLDYYNPVTTATVTAAGALMDSEVDVDIKTLALPANTTISAFGAALVEDPDAVSARSTLGVVATADVATTVILTAAEYAGLTPDPNTIYYVVG